MMKYLVPILLFLVACAEKENEVLDLNDIQAQSKHYKEGNVKSDTLDSADFDFPLNLNLQMLAEVGLHCQDKAISDTLLFPDRFSPIHLSKFSYQTKDESVNFTQYNFKDSVKTQNVFLNWTNCFGLKCNTIRIGETKNLQKNGFLMLVNDTCIVYISSNSTEEKKKWMNYFTTPKDIHWRYVLNQSKQGKVKWQSYTDNAFITIEPIIRNEEI